MDKPATVFSRKINPAGVLDVLRDQGAKVRCDGPDHLWREGTATWGGGLFGGRKREMRIRHNPGYYADESFGKQLPGMAQFLARLPTPVGLFDAVRTFRFAVFLFAGTQDPNDPRWKATLAVCAHLDGVIVLPTAFLDRQGRALVRTDGWPDPEATPPELAEPNPLLVPTGLDRVPEGWELPPYRAPAAAALTEAGFKVPLWLPTNPPELRPAEKIAQRALALGHLFVAVAAEGEPAERCRARLQDGALASALTSSEAALLGVPEDEARNRVGWRLENLWALCWALGFEPAPPTAPGMIQKAQIDALLAFLRPAEGSVDALLASAQPRSVDEVAALEDRFLLAHHAVRSAQLGKATVPPGFHPVSDGGVIHERRHALTWMVSGGVAWDDTELST